MSSTFTFSQCEYCDGFHTGSCSRIKAIEYHDDGTVKRVELHPDVSHIKEWDYNSVKDSYDSKFHICNCIGCCPRCGSCATNPTHTKELCDMLQRHKTEREDYYGKIK